MKRYPLDALALLAGVLLPFAFAPFYISPLAFLAPALLVTTWMSTSPGLAFRRGFLFGIGLFGVGISWVYVSIHVFGGAPVPLAILITVVFIAYLSLFPAMNGYYLAKFFPNDSMFKILCVFPVMWLIFEILRGWLFTGFPWLLLGYSQSNTWLKGYAPLFGVYGLSLITLLVSALLYMVVKSKEFRTKGTTLLLILFLLGAGLTNVNWTQAVGRPLEVTLIQGNIKQELKWQPEQILKTFDVYTEHTQKNWSSDLIIWPEAAITLPLDQAQNFIDSLSQLAEKNGTTIITGVPIIKKDAAFNSMIAIGNGKGTYHKRHLVPFGEYIPLEQIWRFVMQAFQIPMSNCQPGAKNQNPLIANGIEIAPYICYEVAYPLEFLAFLPEAKLLLTITDDSWFGHSIAAMQHLQMAQLRALETGRFLLFSSNTGITAAINSKGQIIKTIPAFQEAELKVAVQPMEGKTPWIIWKMYPLTGLMVVTFVLGRVNLTRRKRSKMQAI